MPLDRTDAVVIGAGVEGLTAALTLALGGKQTLCVDQRGRVEELGRPDEAWVSARTVRTLGLFEHGLRLAAPSPHLALNGGVWTALWPDSDRTARTLTGDEADAFLETAACLLSARTALREPGAAARAMLSGLDLVRTDGGRPAELGHFLRASASDWLARRLDDANLRGLMLAMAARQAPVSPVEAASAPMLLALSPFLDEGAASPKLVAGGAQSLIVALAAAFKAAGGELLLGHEVREIVMEREAVTGVALSQGGTVKAAMVVAAVAPKRLTQGLLSTRRYGRLLSGLRAAPRKAQSILRLSFADAPAMPEARLGLWRGGVSVWLGATDANLSAAAEAMRERRVHETPVLEVRFGPDLREALAAAPFCPGELSDGPWTPARRDSLRNTMLAWIRAQWPEAHGLIEEAELIAPRVAETLGSTGAIFGGAERMPDMDGMFALGGETSGPLLKGVHLCVARALDPEGQAGILAASAAAGLSQARLRA